MGALPPNPGTGLAPAYHPAVAAVATSGQPSGGSTVSTGPSPWTTMTSNQSGYMGMPPAPQLPFGPGLPPGLAPDAATALGAGVPLHATSGWTSAAQPVAAAAWPGFAAPYTAAGPAPGMTAAAALGGGPRMFHAGAMHPSAMHHPNVAAYGGQAAVPAVPGYMHPGLGLYSGMAAQPPFPGFAPTMVGWQGVQPQAYPGFPAAATYPAVAAVRPPQPAPHPHMMQHGYPTYAAMHGVQSESVPLSTLVEPSTSTGSLPVRDLDVSRASAHSIPSVASLHPDMPAPLGNSPHSSSHFQGAARGGACSRSQGGVVGRCRPPSPAGCPRVGSEGSCQPVGCVLNRQA